MSNLKGKNIIIGVTGCIAAYKIAELVRLFVKAEANVEVIMTQSASKFVTPLTLSTLSKNKVHIEMFEEPDEYCIDHISLADKADVFLIAPATANIIGKIANGIADDLLTTTVMATKAPVLIAPAMNSNMWSNNIVQENITKLEQNHYRFIPPEAGELACGYEGEGRLRNIEMIYYEVSSLFAKKSKLKGKKILVSVGPTREYIDPVRFISNKSSGKMGLAIASEAVSLGADVTTISSVGINLPGVKNISVETASQMLEELKNQFSQCDILIMSAAVADYTVKDYSEKKIKKDPQKNDMTIELVKTQDLIAEMSKIKQKHQLIIGFAAETDDLIANATKKLHSKNLDLIVANDVSRKDIGMESDFNEVTFIYPDGRSEQLTKAAKSKVAANLLDRIIELL